VAAPCAVAMATHSSRRLRRDGRGMPEPAHDIGRQHGR
jgi:hypothetical protein